MTTTGRTGTTLAGAALGVLALAPAGCAGGATGDGGAAPASTPAAATTPPGRGPDDGHPWHTGIVATTFWVGEIFDPNAEDGSQVWSTYDGRWMETYGGCDGVVRDGVCATEPRAAGNDFFPSSMTPRENPFYVALPYDDLNDPEGFARRCEVIPWADAPGAARCGDEAHSYLKNRWVQIVGPSGDTCYGQVEDAGPGEYHDAAYVFGADDARPANRRYDGSGIDVSPALNGCLAFTGLEDTAARVDWRFVAEGDVPEGPWTRLVTTSPVTP